MVLDYIICLNNSKAQWFKDDYNLVILSANIKKD